MLDAVTLNGCRLQTIESVDNIGSNLVFTFNRIRAVPASFRDCIFQNLNGSVMREKH